MKKIALIFVLVLVLLAKVTIGYTASANDEMIDLAAVVMKHDLTVETWQVTVKEEKSRKEIRNLVKQLKNSYLVSTEKTENVIKYSFSDAHKTVGIIESFKVIIPKNPAYKSEVIAVIEGNHWDKSVKQNYTSTINALPENMFTKNAQKFTCLTTESNGIIDSDVFLKKFMQDFQIDQVSTQTDTVKHSTIKKNIYGYTPLWDRYIDVNGTATNVQVAVNDNNENTKLTIGTPILVTEY
ncbi:YwmB family TATA-box binding protein [Lentibacillus sp. N15]|uniref:YwmB family TATA-box binding protein n=1 Tax=Lentibacillus songyuanensis TaxID=3136161 RepID=UPI0031BAE74E